MSRSDASEVQSSQYTAAILACRIAEAMKAGKVSQRTLARRMGVSEGRVSQLLSADANPTLRSLCRMAHALGMRLDVTFAAPLDGEPVRTCRCSGGFVCTPCKEARL